MKIHEPEKPPVLLRINIKKQGAVIEFITVSECGQQEFYDYVKALIGRQKLSSFQTGKATYFEIRIEEGSTKGKPISLSFKGLEPKQVKDLILKDIFLCNLQSSPGTATRTTPSLPKPGHTPT